VKPGDVIEYKRELRKPDEDPSVYAFAGIIVNIEEGLDGREYKIFWSDYMNFDDLIPADTIEHYYEVIHETW